MFEALMVSLGEFQLLKGEDGDRLFPNDRYRIPDFRIVLKDDSHCWSKSRMCMDVSRLCKGVACLQVLIWNDSLPTQMQQAQN